LTHALACCGRFFLSAIIYSALVPEVCRVFYRAKIVDLVVVDELARVADA
jgi:hypothetical protein